MAEASVAPEVLGSIRRLTRSEVETLLIGVLAAASALVAGRVGAAPTGARPTDVALAGLLGAAVVALGSRASPLALAVGAAVATVAGEGGALRATGLVALLVAAGLAVTRGRGAGLTAHPRPDPPPGLAAGAPPAPGPPRLEAPTDPAPTDPAPADPAPADPAPVRALVAAAGALLIVQVLLRLPLDAPERGSALVAAVSLAPVAWSGWRGLARPTRRTWRWVAVGLGAVVALGLVSGTVAGLRAASSLRAGAAASDDGLTAVRDGDQAEAEVHFRAATDDLGAARAATRAWWSLPARHVPLVAPQLAALDAMAHGGAETAELAADGAGRIDSDRLRLVDGRLDPIVVAEVGPVLDGVADGTARLRRSLGGRRGSAWQLPPVADALDRFEDRLADAEGSARTGALAAEVGPALLGADGEARYFVAFVTPSEARGTGFLGSYGLLTVTDGEIDLTIVGRNKDLNEAGPVRKEISGPPDYLARYSRFEPQSTWENVTFTPDGPTAGQVMAELYPQSGGEEVDGVLRIDPTGLSRLLRVTGPVEVPGLPYALDAQNVVSFLEVEQYRRFTDRDERVDVLGDVAAEVFDALTRGEGVAPARLARTLGPAVRGGNVSLWLRSPRAQHLVERLGATGAVPEVRGDGFGVVTQNAAGNKVDAFLQRTIQYRAEVDAATGRVEATAEIGLTNRAPTSGEPPYIIGNLIDAPPGTNRMWLSIYSPLDLVIAEVDGQAVTLEPGRELGRNVWSVFVDVPPGASANVTVELSGAVDLSAGRYRFDLLPQAMVLPDRVDVEVTVRGGRLTAVPTTPAPEGGVEGDERRVRAGVGSSRGTWAVVAEVHRDGTD